MKRRWQCPKTCNTCGMCLDGDKRSHAGWSSRCSEKKVRKKCPLTCGVCEEGDCKDRRKKCPRWADQCDRMKRQWQCPKTCNTCGMCLDGDKRCRAGWSSRCSEKKVRKKCPLTCGVCQPEP